MPTPTTKDLTLLTPSDLAADFDTDLTTGLTTNAAAKRRQEDGPNQLTAAKNPVYGGKSGIT